MKALMLGVFLVAGSLFQGIHTAQPIFPRMAMSVSAHPRLLVVGDGLSVGYDATDAQHRYVALLAHSMHAQLTMRAVGGVLTPTFYGAMLKHPPAQADIIVVEMSIDDGGKDYWPFLRTYPKLLALLRRISPNAVLVCAGPWQPHSRTQDGNSVYIRNFCQARGGIFVDLQSLYATAAYHWATRNQWIAWLGVHSDPFLPNDAGMAAISSAFLVAMRSEIAQREGTPPSIPLLAIICACIAGFFIIMLFILPIPVGRRKKKRTLTPNPLPQWGRGRRAGVFAGGGQGLLANEK